MTDNTNGYWFALEDKLPNSDNRPVIAGKSLSVEGKLMLCRNGLHYSLHPFDALSYAKGFNLWKVKALGEVLQEDDKCCTNKRLHLQKVDAKETVLLFARQQANKVLHLWNAPAVVKEFLETGNVNAAADAVAYAAAYAAPYAARAAVYAARAVAYADAAHAAYTAYTASTAASSTAASSTAYRQEFLQMVEKLFAT